MYIYVLMNVRNLHQIKEETSLWITLQLKSVQARTTTESMKYVHLFYT
jgi:hypothetical protein